MPWFRAGGCYMITDSSSTAGTTTATCYPLNRYSSSTVTATTTATPLLYWYYFDDSSTASANIVWIPVAESLESPAIMRLPRQRTIEEIAREEQEQYQRAIAEHDLQEADRIARMIAEREQRQAALVEQQAQRQAAQAEQLAQRALAGQRAREFLLEHLNPQQVQTFERNGWFVVEGGRTKKKYRIRAVESMCANVDLLDSEERMVHRLCGHVPVSKVPLGDQLLAQKMMLEFSEGDFLRIANRH